MFEGCWVHRPTMGGGAKGTGVEGLCGWVLVSAVMVTRLTGVSEAPTHSFHCPASGGLCDVLVRRGASV